MEFQKSGLFWIGYVDEFDVEFSLLLQRDGLGNHLVDDHLRRLFGCVAHRHRVRSQQIHYDVQRHLLLHALQHAQKLDLVVGDQAVAALALSERGSVAKHRHETRLDVLEKLVFRSMRMSGLINSKNASCVWRTVKPIPPPMR